MATAEETASGQEEQAFSEFLAAFKTGPGTTLPTAGGEDGVEGSTVQETEAKTFNETTIDPLKRFLTRGRKQIWVARRLFTKIKAASDEATRQKRLGELGDQVSDLKDIAGLPELLPFWQVATAVEGLLRQLANQSSKVTPSTLDTVGIALKLLVELCRPGLKSDLVTRPPLRFLAVDDGLICRHAVGLALKKAFNQPDTAANGDAALVLAEQHAYDAIFLDIQMPVMDGFGALPRESTRHPSTARRRSSL